MDMTKRQMISCIGSKVMYRGEDLEIVSVRKYRDLMFVLSNGAILLPSEIK